MNKVAKKWREGQEENSSHSATTPMVSNSTEIASSLNFYVRILCKQDSKETETKERKTILEDIRIKDTKRLELKVLNILDLTEDPKIF